MNLKERTYLWYISSPLITSYLGPGMARGGASLVQQQTFIIALAIFALANPGRTLGLDGLLFSGGKGRG
jgi:hypothetical protein